MAGTVRRRCGVCGGLATGSRNQINPDRYGGAEPTPSMVALLAQWAFVKMSLDLPEMARRAEREIELDQEQAS